MKAVMYHYVRPAPDGMPHFRYLHVDDFNRQLDHFAETEGFVSRDDFEAALSGEATIDSGVVLTFDDGFRDHFDHVLPVLEARGLWGIFYIPTGVHQQPRLLNVHRVHCLLGTLGGDAMVDALEARIRPEMLVHEEVDAFRSKTYPRQKNDDATTLFKRMMNYYIGAEWRDGVLDDLVGELLDERALHEIYYVSPDMLSQMQSRGMMVGSHSVSHPVFSTLEGEDQRREITESFAFLEEATGGLTTKTFCYPYGGFHSFTDETERLLSENGVGFSFNVEARDISPDDFANRRQALPRYDCNAFAFGAARMGADFPDTHIKAGA